MDVSVVTPVAALLSLATLCVAILLLALCASKAKEESLPRRGDTVRRTRPPSRVEAEESLDMRGGRTNTMAVRMRSIVWGHGYCRTVPAVACL